MGTWNVTRAARLMVLHELAEAGYLEGMTLQAIANVFDVHRSTIMRDLRVLPEMGPLVRDGREKWMRAYPRMKEDS